VTPYNKVSFVNATSCISKHELYIFISHLPLLILVNKTIVGHVSA